MLEYIWKKQSVVSKIAVIIILMFIVAFVVLMLKDSDGLAWYGFGMVGLPVLVVLALVVLIENVFKNRRVK